MDIGSRIRSARKRAGLSQEEVARRAGMSLNGMANIERGIIPDPHISSLRSIAEALGVSVGELVGEPVLSGKAEAPIDTVRAGEEQREDLGDAHRPRYSGVPHSNPMGTAQADLEALYGPWEEHVKRFVDRWMKKLEAGDFDPGEVKEGLAILKDLTQELSKLNAQEKQDLSPQPAPYGFPEARTGRAMYRLNDLYLPLQDAARSGLVDAELEAVFGEIPRA